MLWYAGKHLASYLSWRVTAAAERADSPRSARRTRKQKSKQLTSRCCHCKVKPNTSQVILKELFNAVFLQSPHDQCQSLTLTAEMSKRKTITIEMRCFRTKLNVTRRDRVGNPHTGAQAEITAVPRYIQKQVKQLTRPSPRSKPRKTYTLKVVGNTGRDHAVQKVDE